MSFNWIEERAYNVYSQSGEDGVLQAIFSVIRPANEWCLECGASDGLFFSNTRRLIEQGWRGVLIEADQLAFKRLCENSEKYADKVRCIFGKVDDTVRLDGILRSSGAPIDIDLVVIDVDGQDYYLLNSLFRYRPRVVVIEYGPNAADDFIPVLGGDGQAGLNAMRKLANGKFYTEVYRSFSNLVLVRQPDDRLLEDSALNRNKPGD